VPLAERPDLAAAIPDILSSRWPTFMLAGNPGHQVDLTHLLTEQAPHHQILLLDTDDTVLGVGLSVPLHWDGTSPGLPPGWDGAVTASADLLAQGASPSMVSALSVTISPQAAGQGHAASIIRALKAAAARIGAPGLLVPVRPILKPQYPLIPLDRFIAWRTPNGRVFDPWLRLHQRLGAKVLAIAHHSMTITGSASDWEDWTGLAFPESGDYTIPGGLVPLPIDRETDTGTYREPNVWVFHPGD
jgi:GNAT superfamily N-acetyltransferase